MNQQTCKNGRAVPRPRTTLMMVLCGVIGAVSMGAAAAAAVDADVPSVVVRYRPASLTTDSGTRTLYRRLVDAAEATCPTSPGTRFVSLAVRECRDQAVARAVRQIGNRGLAALHAGSSKNS